MIIKTYIFLLFRILADISVLFTMVIWLYSSNFIFYVCSVALRKKSGEMFFFFNFCNKIQDGRRITCYSEELEQHSPICSKEATYPGHMLIRFWCDSAITFSSGLHKNLVTVLYFFIINVLCGAGGDASFAPQARLVLMVTFKLISVQQ